MSPHHPVGLRSTLFIAAALGMVATAPPLSAQSDAVWLNISQGTTPLAVIAAQPLGERRVESIRPTPAGPVSPVTNGASGAGLSMVARVVPAAQTTLELPAVPADRGSNVTIAGFVLRTWKSNGTAYVQVATLSMDSRLTNARENPLTTIALTPGESRELVEARTFGAAPLTITATSGSPSALIAANAR